MSEIKFLMVIVEMAFRLLAIIEIHIEKAALLAIEEYKKNPDANQKCYPDIIKRRGKIFIGWRKVTWRNNGRFEIIDATYYNRAIGANLLTYEDENQKIIIENTEKKLRKLRDCLILIKEHRKNYKIIANRVRNIHETTAANHDE